MDIYTKKVMEHFLHPKNMGEIRDASGVGKAGNIVCGDIMKIFIKVEEKNGKRFIKDIKFKTLGCAAAIASSSMITELAKGKTIEEAMNITKDDVARSLGGLPPIKMHCSLLSTDALSEAIYDYLSKNNLPVPDKLVKIHRRVQKENEIAEKKYKEFVEMQKRVIGG